MYLESEPKLVVTIPVSKIIELKPQAKVMNLVPTIVPFFHYNETCPIYVSVYQVRTVLNFKKKYINVQKFEILFKFVYIGWYLTENTGTARYLAVQTGTGRYLIGTISDINMHRFFGHYGMVRLVRYVIYNYAWDYN